MPIAFAFCTKRSTPSLAPGYGLSAAEKRQPQQWLEKSVSRLCPGGGRDRGGDTEGAARSSRPLAKSPPPGLGSRRSEFPLSRVASCPTTVEAARRLPSGRSRCGQSLRASRPRPATRSSANGRAIGSSGHSCLWRSHAYSLGLNFSVSHRGPLFFWQREPFRKFQEQPRSLRD